MTHVPQPIEQSRLTPIAIWVAIGALIAAAIVCVVWVLAGPAEGIVARAFWTIFLLAAFAGVAILDAHLARRRPGWFVLTSMIVWVVTLLLGAFLIWMPATGFGFGYERFLSFLLIVLILQLGVLHVRLYEKAYRRNVTTFTTIAAIATITLVALLAVMLVFPLAFGEFFRFTDTYWRWVVAFAILAAVGTALLPLVNALFAPPRTRAVAVAPAEGYPPPLPAWPTYVDGVTPLPVLVDGSPDWNAYYTGYPTTSAPSLAAPEPEWQEQAQAHDPAQRAWADLGQENGWGQQDPVWPPLAEDVPPAAPSGYDGYPPPPPLPPLR